VSASGEIAAPLKRILHIGIMVVTQGHARSCASRFSLQFPSDMAVLAACRGSPARKPPVSPQLALGTENGGASCSCAKPARLHESGPNRRKSGEAIFTAWMLTALASSKFASRLLTHRLQQIQLLIEAVRPGDELRAPGSCLTILCDGPRCIDAW